ncbi:TcdA/TcdB catalytic glycosyltransferase domain-containing protein [Streptomyces olivaceus]|uniref:TcdA/TcdB catalytic glycosyltransferase domain-containing protein n=1 Tax=Streptomyces olivaceus TaxID=47716 RepID=UPI0036E304F5
MMTLQRLAGNEKVSREVNRHAHEAPTVQRAPLGVSHPGPAGQELDSDNESEVREYVFTSLANGNHEAVDVLLGRLKALSPQPAYLDKLTTAVEEGRKGGDDRPKIPSEVHFIWVGGDIPGPALENIMGWAQTAANTDWTINLWTDKNTKLSWPTWGKIKVTGKLKQRFIEDAIDPRMAASYQTATTDPKQKAYPFASDIARYSILKKFGGVYADVDLGSGTVRLQGSEPRLREQDLPVMGPLVRDKRQLDGTLKDAGGKGLDKNKPVKEQIRPAVDHLLRTGGYGNHFIAAQKDSAVMDKLIARIADKIEAMDLHTGEDLQLSGPAVSGPFALIPVVQQHLRDEFGVGQLNDGEYDTFNRQGKEFHDGMDWLTEESENQNY